MIPASSRGLIASAPTMARKMTGAPALSDSQAAYVLERLLADRRISPNDVTRYVAAMRDEIAELEARIAALRGRDDGHGQSRSRGTGREVQGKRPAPSPARKASQQLQGKYISLVRQVPKAQRGKYQTIAKEQGREAAIRALTAALKSKRS